MAGKKRVAPRRISDSPSTPGGDTASAKTARNGGIPGGGRSGNATRSGPPTRSTAKGSGGTRPAGGSRPGTGAKPSTKASAKQRSQATAMPSSARRFSPALIGWVSGGVVVVLVLVFVVIAVTRTAAKAAGRTTVPTQILNLVENVPSNVLDTVGIDGQKASTDAGSGSNPIDPVTGTSADLPGKTPTFFYYGAEFCPYCATERWSLIVALSKFGTFSGLGGMASDPNDVYPNTQTFTFYLSHYKSKYINFEPVEAEDVNRNALQDPNAAQLKVLAKWNPGLSFPFIDIGGKYIGSLPGWLNPAVLGGLSRLQIAQAIQLPTNAAGSLIDANANYLTAAICSVDGDQPASVCHSSGVEAAAAQLKKLPPAVPISQAQ